MKSVDDESQSESDREVIVASHQASEALTASLRRPSALDSSVTFIASHRVFATDYVPLVASADGTHAPKALLLRRELTRAGTGLVAAAGLLLTVVPGMAVGFRTGMSELGVGLSAAIAAVLGLLVLFRR
jgi:hypothetical protein